jgi:hypothetical protein
MKPRWVASGASSNTRRSRLWLSLCAGAMVVAALVVSLASLALAASSFPDVPSSHPYHAAITDLADRGIIGGYADGNFGPGDPVTRQQFAKMVVLTGGYPVSEANVCFFTDVEKSDASTLYPDNYIAVAAANGITTGKTPTTFDPYSNITRYQVVTMVVRMADNLQPGLLVAPPVGYTTGAGWETDPTHGANAARAAYNGILAGLDLSALDPRGNMNRGEVAQVLHNLLLRVEQTTSTSSSSSTTASSTTTSSTTTTTEAPGDLMHFWWTAADNWEVENISAATGVKVTGPPGMAVSLPGMFGFNIVAKGSSGDLYGFPLPSGGPWMVGNVSQGIGKPVAGPLASLGSMNTAANRSVDGLAGPAEDGDLLHFWWGHDGATEVPFSYEDITTLTGQKIQGEVATYTTYWGAELEAEHIVARSLDNDLLVFWDVAPQHNWVVVNISAITGKKIMGSPVAWTRSLGGNATEDHIAAVGLDGHLLHFWWRAQYGWKVEDLSAQLGGPTLAGAVLWCGRNTDSSGQIDNLATPDSNGYLLHWWSSTGFNWQVENVSAATGRRAWGPLGSYYDADHSGKIFFEHIVGEGLDGHLLIFWTELQKHNWSVVDVTAITGERMEGPFTWWAHQGPDLPLNPHLVGVKH